MCFIFYLGHLKIHSNSLYLGHTVNSLSNAWKTHLFLCTIRYFSSFPYNPSDGQLPQSFAVTCDSAFPLVLQDEKYKRILGTCRRSKTEGSPLPQSSSAQHAHLSPGQALQGHAHALLTGQKPGFQNPQSLKRESKTWDHTYSENRGKPHGECELPYCLMLLGLTDGNPYRTCTIGRTRQPPGHPSFEVVAHSPAAAAGCTHQFASFQVGEETSN